MIGVLAFGEYDAKITDSKKISSLTMARPNLGRCSHESDSKHQLRRG